VGIVPQRIDRKQGFFPKSERFPLTAHFSRQIAKSGGKNAIPYYGRKRIFASKKGAATLLKIFHFILPFPYFSQIGCVQVSGIFVIPFVIIANFFSFHICDQRKEAKERRLIIIDILGY
jgi:hypothetical protein